LQWRGVLLIGIRVLQIYDFLLTLFQNGTSVRFIGAATEARGSVRVVLGSRKAVIQTILDNGGFMKRASLSVAIITFAGIGVLLLYAGRPSNPFPPSSTHGRPAPGISRASNSSREVSHPAISRFAKQPLRFEANTGQTDSRVNYLARGDGYTVFLAGGDAVLKVRASAPMENPRIVSALGDDPGTAAEQSTPGESGAVLRLDLAGAHANPSASGEEPLPGTSNYFQGASPAQWRTHETDYGGVRYRGVYPGIDVLYHANNAFLEYDFDVAPGADPRLIRLKLTGAQRTGVAPDGDLVVNLGAGEVRMHKPVIYQETPRGRSQVDGGYILLADNEAGFRLGRFDRGLPLVIDPTLAFSTYLGGNERELMFGLALDQSDDVYVCGTTYSTDFPTSTGAFQTSYAGNEDAFVSKLSADGSTLIYSTYIGGSGLDVCDMIAVNSLGEAYITGHTSSRDFPTTKGVFQRKHRGKTNAFVAKLNPTGTALEYCSYLGGALGSYGYGIALDAAGDAYIAGYTISPDFPTVNPIQPTLGGSQDAFVAEVNPMATALIYSTYLGGSGPDIAYMIAVDSTGAAYVGGRTSSRDFPTANAIQGVNNGLFNGFVAEIKPNGAGLAFSTYLGGSTRDAVIGVAIDGAQNVYVTGFTQSADFPVKNAVEDQLRGRQDAFVTAFAAGGQSLNYSRYLGGDSRDFGEAIWADAKGNAYVTGETRSTNFPVVNPVQANFAGGDHSGDAFITELRVTGTTNFSTYLGGTDNDAGYAIAADGHRNIYVAGRTNSPDFPLANPLQGTYSGNGDTWVALITP
jgi:hypothetical protein